jgi:hypothetical protein
MSIPVQPLIQKVAGVKRLEREADNSVVHNERRFTSNLSVRLHDVVLGHRNNFIVSIE